MSSASDFLKWCAVFGIQVEPPTPGPYLPLAGGTMSGNINMANTHIVTGLANAAAATDAVSYQFMQAYILTLFGGATPGDVGVVNSGGNLTPTPITGAIGFSNTGVTSFNAAAAGTLLSNITGTSAAPTYNTFTASLDAIFGNTAGDILFRGVSAWQAGTTLPSAVQTNITQLGTQAQALSMGTFQINNLGSPSSSTDAATKGYVDSVAAGLGPAGPVQFATTVNFAATYNNGTAGVGATLTASSTGVVTFDGYTPLVGDRGLFKNQTTGTQNGVYVCTVAGAVGVNAVFTRASDYDTPTDINNTGIIPVVNGSTQANTGWYQINDIITIGVTSLSFIQFGNSGTVTSITAGAGLSGGTITGSGTIAVLSQSNNTIMSNISGISAVPIGNTISALFDSTLGNTQGDIIFRGSSTWMVLSPTNGVLTMAAGVPSWESLLATNLGGTGVGSVTTAPTANAFAGWDANSNLSANNTIEGYATTVTAAGTTTLTVASAFQQFFTGTTTQNCKMPVTSTLVAGQSWFIVNNSTGVVTVQSSGSNTITALAAGTSAIVTCTSTSGTSAASWNASVIGASAGGYLVPQITILTSGSGTYTTPANTVILDVFVKGGGGPGAANAGNGGGGGGEGGTAISLITSPSATYSYAVAASQSSGTGNNSTFGTLTGTGGQQGGSGIGGLGGVPTGGNLQNIPGAPGGTSGYQGSPYYGGNGGGEGGGVGSPGTSNADANSGGGGGGSTGAGTGAGIGASGIIVVTAWVSGASVAAGTITTGTAGQLAVYNSTGTTISGQTTITAAQNGVTMVQKSGTGAGSYSTNSGTLVDVDATNLSYTVTIPVGYKLQIMASACAVGTAGGSNEIDLAITDISTATVLTQMSVNPAVSGGSNPFTLISQLNGDGNSHTIRLQYLSSNGITSSILNGATNRIPLMDFLLTPSN